MRSGGGVAGNLSAGTLKTIAATTLNGTRRRQGSRGHTAALARRRRGSRDARRGGEAHSGASADTASAQSPPTTIARWRARRPVSRSARVELLPRFKPQQRHEDIPGVVTVMVLPARPLAPAPNPRADRPFLEAVYAWLDARRPLGVELYVIGCEYVPVAVSVAVTVGESAAPETTLQAVKEALVRVLWPLAGGGFDRQGWPLGRALSNRELAVEVARVQGVSEVAGLNLFPKNISSGAWVPLAIRAMAASKTSPSNAGSCRSCSPSPQWPTTRPAVRRCRSWTHRSIPPPIPTPSRCRSCQTFAKHGRQPPTLLDACRPRATGRRLGATLRSNTTPIAAGCVCATAGRIVRCQGRSNCECRRGAARHAGTRDRRVWHDRVLESGSSERAGRGRLRRQWRSHYALGRATRTRGSRTWRWASTTCSTLPCRKR